MEKKLVIYNAMYCFKEVLINLQAIPKPKLTPDNVRDILVFVRQYENRTNRFWYQVIFADETRLTFHSVDARLRIRGRRGEQVNQNYYWYQFSWKYGGGSMMFWSFITWAGQDPLVLIEGN